MGRSPVCVIRRGDGPMITLIAGLHGDAPEATATLHQLAQTCDADKITGTLVIIPCLDRAEHSNLAEIFRGENSESYADRLANLIESQFINNASLVVDCQSGGSAFGFASSAAIVQQSDRDQQQRAEEYMIAFGAPNSVRLPGDYASSLDRACENSDIPCIRLLLGGQGTCSADVMEITWRGCQNLFSHCGLVQQELTLCATRMLEVSDDHSSIHATKTGLQHSTARLGGELWRGDVMIDISDPMSFGAPPLQLTVPRDSVVLGMCQSGPCTVGECLLLLADEVQR